MKHLVKATLIAAVAAAGLMATTATTSAQEVTMRFQHFISPKGAVPRHFIVPWAEKVMKESNGRIKIEIYPAMQLGGKPPALFDQIRDGVIDGGWAIPGYTPGRFPGTDAFELPFMGTKSAEETSKATWEFYQKYLTKAFQDVRVLAMHVHGPGVIHVRNKSVKTLADMKGLKIRTPTRTVAGFLAAMGATPVGMPVPAFPQALSKGVVDGGVIPWEIVPPLKVHELATSHTIIGGDRALYNTVFIWAMNKNTYAKLPADLKAVIDANSGLATSAWAGRAMDTGDKPGLALTKKSGNEIINLSEAETAKWRELAQPLIQKWIAENSKKGLPAAQMVSDARALVKKHAGQ